ncbi:N-acyl-phosphatidylethanolamine-hydrolyzing phospholipase D isoform X1 [Patella vulgata]|uniref:N-acyl-phosphatidylethanolamine-hydrolyzing phospholipase D isoform X1 n=2 Tax=Patella vulgata TaxID=6465 RepID=UPI00217F36D9|nr:N-acyl-phosphatidylethanolamine-hydrolyzing phospholipase D isoform X1 [Patella vulgata]XP_055958071.1 N-acyl-phosphatidylethanolamine-hydrolyzing phospholipase D isoform X1 [Patella vulgata]
MKYLWPPLTGLSAVASYLIYNKFFDMATAGEKSVSGSSSTGPQTDELTRPLFKDGCFYNPWKTWRDPKLTNLFKFIVTEKDNSNIPGEKELDIHLPIIQPDLTEFDRPVLTGVKTMWIGHASVLVKFDDITVLTDPVFSERCSIVSFAGPKRYRRVPCQIKDLPKIDAVVISHNHYDHLDLSSVKELNQKFGKDLRWYVPQGMKKWMSDSGCENVEEMTWWEEQQFPGKPDVKFVSTPAQHWSKRGVTDTNKALWGGWAVIGPKHSFYFAGDTGYCEGFKEIGEKYGPFTLAAIPIGAYEPRWFMCPQHVDPVEAVDIHLDIKAEHSLGIHWGTFKLTYEPYMEPKEKLEEELKKRSISLDEFITLKHGEIKTVGYDEYSQMD